MTGQEIISGAITKNKLSHHPIDQFNGKVRQQQFGTYISTRQRKLHKEISEMLVSLRAPNLDYTNVKEEKDYSEDEDESTDEHILQPFQEEHKAVSKDKTPILFEMFMGTGSVPTRILNALFCEIVNVLKKKDNSVDFIFGNDKCGRAIIVPQVKTLPSFMEKAHKLKWIAMLEHIAVDSSDLADAAEWICYYIGKKHDASFTLASESLGYPLVQ